MHHAGRPIGFIVNELITNSAKYGPNNIIGQFGRTPAAGYLLSVLDTRSKGLGIKLVLALVTQISGELKIVQGNSNRGTNFTVIF
jgi:two-component sensor histidine kinase